MPLNDSVHNEIFSNCYQNPLKNSHIDWKLFKDENIVYKYNLDLMNELKNFLGCEEPNCNEIHYSQIDYLYENIKMLS